MSDGILVELYFFGQSFLCGVALALLYGGICLLRSLVRHKNWAIAVEDLLYWVICGVFIFRMLYEENSGEVRWFAIAAVVLGMLLCLYVGKLLDNLRKKLHNLIKKGIIDKHQRR